MSRAALVLAGVFWSWTAGLLIFGGFDVHVFGLSLTSNDPTKPLWVALTASVVFGLTAPPARRAAIVDRLAQALRPVIVVPLLVAWVAVISVVYATNAAGGSDSYGYASQADLWIQGTLRVQQPWVADLPWPDRAWTAAPLGYRPAEEFGTGTLVPTTSPGLPLMMAGLKLVGGHCAMFLIIPLCAALMVGCTYGIGHRLAMPTEGMIAAALVACSPTFLFFAMVPMSDVPVAGLWSLVFFAMLGSTSRAAVLTGFACALALLVRPNLVFLSAIVGLRYLIAASAPGLGWRSRAVPLIAFSVGLAPAIIVIPLIYSHLYGSPYVSGYGPLGDLFGWTNLSKNVSRYLSWFVETQTAWPLISAFAWLVPARRLWPAVRDRRLIVLLGLCVLALWLHYFAYLVIDDWGSLRFLLPSWPLVMLGFAAVMAALLRGTGMWAPFLAASATITLCLHTVGIARERGAFDLWTGDREWVAISKLIASDTPAQSVFFTMQHSGSLRYYSGRLTLRYDPMDVAWLDRGIEWLRTRGVAAYALLDEWEVPEFRRRFPNQRATGRLATPLWVFTGRRRVYLYDLAGDSRVPPAAIDRSAVFSQMSRCDPPVPLAVPSFGAR